ncbi:hypothetical protein [Sandarakinorhabdus oryzae]|uniref:hypothetical protein n=1 Tax=Sandarakinorhabdus oryzae TaxID=2675220 RepID=UPI0012E23558|nr:hypothetical protein [Sandarakinorhabdus oryzae]
MNEGDIAQAVLAYLVHLDDGAPEYHSLTTIYEKIFSDKENLFWSEDDLNVIDTKEEIRVVLDQMVLDGLLDGNMGERDYETSYKLTDQGIYEGAGFGALITKYTEDAPLEQNEESVPLIEFDSVDWTGLATRITEDQFLEICDKTKALRVAIVQSDVDYRTQQNALGRVKAIEELLQTPDCPWRIVVELLSNPAFSSFMSALSIMQFILGLAK